MWLVAEGAAWQPAGEEESDSEPSSDEGVSENVAQAATEISPSLRTRPPEGGKALTRSATTKA
jgi:hypothetical protein